MPRKGPLGNFDLDEGPDAAPVSEQIIGALIANAGKVIDLFRSWDDNGDGKVTRAEFHKAMIELGLEVPKDSIDSIFSRWDKDGGGELSLPEMTKILRNAATSAKGIEQLRRSILKKGLKLSALFREWDTNGDGEIDKDEFRSALKFMGFKFPKDQVDAVFDSFDREGLGLISTREFNRVLRRDLKAEEAAKRAREEEARKAREIADRVTIVDLTDLRQKLKSVLSSANAVKTIADAAGVAVKPASPTNLYMDDKDQQLGSTNSTLPAAQTILSAKQKAVERERLHFQLRLRGTEVEAAPGLPHEGLNRSKSDAILGGTSRVVTRHSRRPRLEPRRTESLPKLIDVLSIHRTRSHCPARKHFHVLQPPAPAKLSRQHLTALKMPSVERTIQRTGVMRTSNSMPNVASLGTNPALVMVSEE